MDLSGQVAVVTGGADGIGLGAARAFAGHGARVVLADRDADKLRRAADDIGATSVVCDVTNDDDVAALVECATGLGDVGVVMANAGVAIGGRFELVPLDEWQRLFDVNVFGVVRTVQGFLPDMLERQAGRIVVTGSSAGLFSVPDGMNAPYSASKFALQGMARALANYCGPSGIGVHYLAPRLTDTAFPRSSVAWGRKGSRVSTDRDIGDDFDTVADVVEALIAGMNAGEFLVSLSGDTEARLQAFATTGSPRS